MRVQGNFFMSTVPDPNMLIIIPVGAYLARVRTAIKWALGNIVSPKKTKIKIIFLADIEWVNSSNSYVKELENLKKEFGGTNFKKLFNEYSISVDTIDFTEQEACIIWLIQNITPFLRKSVTKSATLIDLTLDSLCWLIGCEYISNFFNQINFFQVRPLKQKVFDDYDLDERNDEGLIPGVIELSRPDPLLTRMLIGNSDNYEFFKVINRTALLIADLKKKNVYDVEIPIKSIVEDVRDWMIDSKREGTRSISNEHVLKSVSKRLNQIEKYKLFTRIGSIIKFSPVGYALAQSMFPKSKGRAKS